MAPDERDGAPAKPADRLPILVGTAWALGLDVPAAVLLPLGGPGGRVLEAIEPGLAGRIEHGDFLVGGDRFGRGERAGEAARALRDLGVAAVVAHSFDGNFQAAEDRIGLAAVQLNEALVIHTGARLRVDLEGGRVVNMSSGDRFPIRHLGEDRLATLREVLLAGS